MLKIDFFPVTFWSRQNQKWDNEIFQPSFFQTHILTFLKVCCLDLGHCTRFGRKLGYQRINLCKTFYNKIRRLLFDTDVTEKVRQPSFDTEFLQSAICWKVFQIVLAPQKSWPLMSFIQDHKYLLLTEETRRLRIAQCTWANMKIRSATSSDTLCENYIILLSRFFNTNWFHGYFLNMLGFFELHSLGFAHCIIYYLFTWYHCSDTDSHIENQIEAPLCIIGHGFKWNHIKGCEVRKRPAVFIKDSTFVHVSLTEIFRIHNVLLKDQF